MKRAIYGVGITIIKGFLFCPVINKEKKKRLTHNIQLKLETPYTTLATTSWMTSRSQITTTFVDKYAIRSFWPSSLTRQHMFCGPRVTGVVVFLHSPFCLCLFIVKKTKQLLALYLTPVTNMYIVNMYFNLLMSHNKYDWSTNLPCASNMFCHFHICPRLCILSPKTCCLRDVYGIGLVTENSFEPM